MRRRLGVLVTLWLIGQVFSWSAVAAHLCCLNSAGSEQADSSCHTAVVDQCPMAAADGQPCPMHANHAAAHARGEAAQMPGAAVQNTEDTRPAAAECVMRGACSPSNSALMTLLWVPGILVPPPAVTLVIAAPVAVARPEPLATLVLAHDPPPPRG